MMSDTAEEPPEKRVNHITISWVINTAFGPHEEELSMMTQHLRNESYFISCAFFSCVIAHVGKPVLM